mmetsp:Transcript_5312/g.14621  ORF Transcript_5312/g.14621 Transcript_5312/m.14621 type:complete len:500 (-) Transcript_5312:388-1887(-)
MQAPSVPPIHPCLYAPPPKSTEPIGISDAIDWTRALKTLAAARFADVDEGVPEVSRDAAALRRARSTATVLPPHIRPQEVVLRMHAIQRYLRMLERLEVAAGGADALAAVGKAGKLHFVWRNAFDRMERREHSGSLDHERAGLYFNLAALLALHATGEHVDGPAAAHALQCAAGCIHVARDQSGAICTASSSLNPVTEDMRVECLGALASLYLGQAQCCFAARATGASMALQAKLWGQAAAYLKQALTAWPSSAAKKDKQHLQALAALSLACAHGCQGTARRADKQAGLAVSHLAFALDQFALATKAAATAKAESLMAYIELAMKPVAVEHEVARRDNDNVYFEREVPWPELAGTIECKSSVRPLDLTKVAPLIGESVPDEEQDSVLEAWMSMVTAPVPRTSSGVAASVPAQSASAPAAETQRGERQTTAGSGTDASADGDAETRRTAVESADRGGESGAAALPGLNYETHPREGSGRGGDAAAPSPQPQQPVGPNLRV